MGGGPKRASRAKRWTIGCLTVLAVLIVGVLGFVIFYINPLLDGAALEIQEGVAEAYKNAKAEGRIPDDHVLLYDGLAKMAEDEASTMWSAGLVAAVLVDPLLDGQITDEELSDAVTVDEFVRADPQLGFPGFVKFLTEQPRMMERFQRLDAALAESEAKSLSR